MKTSRLLTIVVWAALIATATAAVSASPQMSPVVANVAKNPADLPAPISRIMPTTVTVNLEAKEVIGEIAPGKTAWFWTFNGTVPGPMIRVMEGDTVVINLTNNLENVE